MIKIYIQIVHHKYTVIMSINNIIPDTAQKLIGHLQSQKFQFFKNHMNLINEKKIVKSPYYSLNPFNKRITTTKIIITLEKKHIIIFKTNRYR
ncbi:unnamed protein product [Aphis gossypii]|uniref:Uncharacterized protein n=1 Tax=Aphis gossypii TaxID=80765 RepID=A0A9P0IIJ9_APHGO|nr:unnamed protein product [Aphis gossypii]